MTASRPTVFILDGSIAVTGAFVSARDMARALGTSADVILILPESAQIAIDELSDFTAVYRLPIRPLRRNLAAVLLYLPHLARATWQLHRLMARYSAAVLIVNDFYLIQGPLLRALGHREAILTWLRIDPNAFGRMGRIWLKISACFSDCLIAVSRHMQELVAKEVNSRLLYDPVSAGFLAPPAPRPTEGREFVFIGNYIEGKGQDLALEAMARLLPNVPQAQLIFHGSDMGLERNRAYRRSLEAKADTLGIASAVTFGNFVSDPRSALDGAFAALNLSRSESFSRTVLESSSCGLPVIATRCGGPAEIVTDSVTGILIPVGDASACALAMQKLCDDPAYAARMGEAGRARVLSTFAPDVFAQELRALVVGKN